MITFIAWKWNQPGFSESYTSHIANVWEASVRRNYQHECRTVLITDDPDGVEFETFPLWSDHRRMLNPHGPRFPSCYRRLKIFDGATTREMGIKDGSPVVSIDLDVVITGRLTQLFADLDQDFKGWRVPGHTHPTVFNGTLFMFRAGAVEYLWKDFDPAKSPKITQQARYFGSDQAWISYRLDQVKPRFPGWTSADGVVSFAREIRNRPSGLPPQAKIVSFNGSHKPWHKPTVQSCPWIKDHWKA